MSELQTTGRRREVGAALKRIRQASGLPAYQLADKLDWTPSHISRSEAGKRNVTDVDAGFYLGMCGVGTREAQEVLKAINEPDDYRVQRHDSGLPDQLRTLIFLESTATKIHDFQPIYISGLLQTADYARALFRETGILAPSQIEDRVQTRMDRGKLLIGPKPPLCVFVVHENALRAPIGGPRVMNEQILHLLFLGNRPECAIRVVPVSAGGAGMASGAFQIFSYKEDPTVVGVQHQTTSEFMENDDEVATYRSIFNRVDNVALDGPQSREFLAMMAGSYERQGDARDDTGGLAEE
jgi:transcriptional regulator with XRE-family HTH domain